MTKPKLSVVIPTVNYESCKEQITALAFILNHQTNPDAPIEIVVVDNSPNASQRNDSVLKNLAKIVREPIIGLSRARNAGVRASVGDIIAFLDDDIVPEKTWAGAIIRAHQSPAALCVGGAVIPKDVDRLILPKWFSDYFLRFIVPPQFPRSADVVTPPHYLIGANMSFKRMVFERYGLFDTNLGRRGNCLLSGEDIEFMMRLKPENIFYEPFAAVSAKITPQRLTRRYFVRRIFWQAVSDARIIAKHDPWRYFDQSELFVSAELIRGFLRKLRRGLFFQAFCMVVRITVFKLTSLFRL